MKIIALFILVNLFVFPVKAEENNMNKKLSFPSSSLEGKKNLGRLPRLGMTFEQLKNLWGKPVAQVQDKVKWQDVGGVCLDVKFTPLFLGENGFNINPSKSRCVSITFSYIDSEAPLTSDDAIKIAEKLLPGVSFPQIASSHVKFPLISENDQGIYQLSKDEKEGFFSVYFRIKPKVIKLEMDKL